MLGFLRRRRPEQPVAAARPVLDSPEALYLDLLKRSLTRFGFEDETIVPETREHTALDLERRRDGRDWPVHAETMVGMLRLDNLQQLLETVIAEDVSGDVIETGVWRGGASIFMRGVLAAHKDRTRTVWLADSFEGLPPPDAEQYPADAGDQLFTIELLAVSLDEVRANFDRYGLLDDRVRFLQGWFRDTLPGAPIQQLSLIRLDGDMYESTIVALDALYPKLSPGGFVVVDDYGAIPGCKQAVDDFRAAHGIDAPLTEIDWTGVWWRRPSA
jgi:O-methyltransferase